MKNVTFAVGFGFLMALIDVFVLTALRLKHEHPDQSYNWVHVLAFLIYGFQSIMFYKSLDYANLVVMNMIWDVSSDILVSLVGFFFLKEVLSNSQVLGVLLGIVSVVLLSQGT